MSQRISSRDKIIQAAKELFYHHGYQATSVDDILRATRVVKSNFYYHFPTKEDLIIAVLEQRVAEYEVLIIQSLQNISLSPAERLDRFFDHICHAQQQLKSAGCPFGNFAASLPSPTTEPRYERFRSKLSAVFYHIEEAMRECLVAGTQQGAFRTDITPREMAAFLMASVQGLLILAKAHQDADGLIRGLAVARHLVKVHKKPETSG